MQRYGKRFGAEARLALTKERIELAFALCCIGTIELGRQALWFGRETFGKFDQFGMPLYQPQCTTHQFPPLGQRYAWHSAVEQTPQVRQLAHQQHRLVERQRMKGNDLG